MSLYVHLFGATKKVNCLCVHCGHAHKCEKKVESYAANITHNLSAMAKEAGVYEAVWRPDEHGFTKAGQLLVPLEKGLAAMRADPSRFVKFNAKNGWGTYEQFLPWLQSYFLACRDNPDADVRVSR